MTDMGSKNAQRVTLGRYFIDHSDLLETVGRGLYGPLDARGVPMIDYDKAFKSHWWLAGGGRNFGVHYTPVTTAQLGFALHECLLSGQREGAAERFLAQADWLRDNLTPMPQGFGLWLHTFRQPSYGIEAPWASAMAQGQGISMLLRAYEFTDDESYRQAAVIASKAYDFALRQGGVAYRDASGDLWFEEYPSAPASHVLNGFMFALWGLYDLYRSVGDERAGALWSDGVVTLARNLRRYDRNGWSRYDLIRDERASLEYHLTHVAQLEVMAKLTGESVFGEYAATWLRNAQRVNLRLLTVERIARGALRRLRVLPRPFVTGAHGHTAAIRSAVPGWKPQQLGLENRASNAPSLW